MSNNEVYVGDCGVFYDAKNDLIFTLSDKYKKRFFNLITKNTREFFVYNIDYGKTKHKQVQVLMHGQVLRVGDL